MKKVLSWAFAAALICGLSVFTSCSNDDNPVVPSNNLAEKLIGKWIISDLDGKPALTNNKTVYTFVSTNKAYSSASFSPNGKYSNWLDLIESDVTISDNKVTLTNHPDKHETGVIEFIITDITDTEFNSNQKLTITVDGKVTSSPDFVTRYTKVNHDYSQDVLGLWECTGLSGGETFNDANARLEFLSDGTYRYYQKNTAGKWVAVTTREFQNYFVDGNFLATRWKTLGEDELREWWEINSLEDGKMQWTALRANEDGTTFQQVMDWKKAPAAKTVDLATLTADYTAQDGDILTGKLAKPVKITVADGASITIENAYINDEGTAYPELKYAGVTCLGDADIQISGNNTIRSISNSYPAFFVPDGHTLCFWGDGSLTARASGFYLLCGAIGSARVSEKCGNLVFMGGKIFAEGGDMSAAIGAGYSSDCGDITIGGTAEIYISSSKSAAAIGSGSGPAPEFSNCGDITIGGRAIVNVTGGSNSAAIGAGMLGNCGNITIGEMAQVTANGIDCGPGIGAGNLGSCKAITIEGGFVRATCDDYGPGIGNFFNGSRTKCESITITGGAVIATGGEDAPAIGSAPESPNGVPVIITSGIKMLTANRGSALADYIGAGVDGTRGSVIIDGVENATPESTFPNLKSSVEGNTWTLFPKDMQVN